MYNTKSRLTCGKPTYKAPSPQLYLPTACFVWLIFVIYYLLWCNVESYTIIEVLYTVFFLYFKNLIYYKNK